MIQRPISYSTIDDQNGLSFLKSLMDSPALFPEFIVKDLERSSHFYIDILGFKEKYSRPEERFQYLSFGRAHIMLLEDNSNQHSRTGLMEYPRGRGVNFSIVATDVSKMATLLKENDYPLRIPIRDQWHRENDVEHGETQLWVMDSDGYLLRFIQPLGTRRHRA